MHLKVRYKREWLKVLQFIRKYYFCCKSREPYGRRDLPMGHVETRAAGKYTCIILSLFRNYDSSNSHNDIAVLITTTEFQFSDYVRPACLPTNTLTMPNREYCIISGWGHTRYKNGKTRGKMSPRLKWASVPIRSQQECRAKVSNDITDQMICAG